MIDRYSRPEMASLWSPEARYNLWLGIELAACDAMATLGLVPKAAAQACRDRAGQISAADAESIVEIEKTVKHDVIAFLTFMEQRIGVEARFLHLGMTSSDVLDTALSVQLTQAADLLLKGLDAVIAAIRRRALEHAHTLTIGRSHGIHAEPTTFGVKLAGHYAAFTRNRARLVAARGCG